MPYRTKAKAPIHILVVDDEPDICAILTSGLKAEGYEVSEACNKVELMQCLQTTPADLITLDLDLSGDDGLQLAREVRAERNVPIVMITGKGEPIDRVKGLEQGADDYIVKPFHIREVVIRIKSVLRRYETELGLQDAAAEERFEYEFGVVDVARRQSRKPDGEIIDLTDVEFDLLLIFLRRPACILTRDELLHLLSGRAWSPQDRTIDGHVARLRRKIDSRGDAPRLIKSVRGIGYVFTGEVRRAAPA